MVEFPDFRKLSADNSYDEPVGTLESVHSDAQKLIASNEMERPGVVFVHNFLSHLDRAVTNTDEVSLGNLSSAVKNTLDDYIRIANNTKNAFRLHRENRLALRDGLGHLLDELSPQKSESGKLNMMALVSQTEAYFSDRCKAEAAKPGMRRAGAASEASQQR